MTRIYVHGGVAGVAKDKATDMSPAVAAGLERDKALDAVEAAVRVLEDDPAHNAGYGSVLDREGGLELDAGLAVGDKGHWAGVGAVAIANPISLARVVLEHTPHVLIAGRGAQQLAATHGLKTLDSSTPEQHARWEKASAEGLFDKGEYGRADFVDTVGAVALDESGVIVAGSSTGGVFGKLPGRMGDAPIFGAGIYADDEVGVIGTGVGELFLETLACKRVADLVAGGTAVQDACETVIKFLTEKQFTCTQARRSAGTGHSRQRGGGFLRRILGGGGSRRAAEPVHI